MKKIIKIFMPVKVGEEGWFAGIGSTCSNDYVPYKAKYFKNDLWRPYKTKWMCQIHCDIHNSNDEYLFWIIFLLIPIVCVISLILIYLIW